MSYQAPNVGGELDQEEFNTMVLEQLREIEKAFIAARPQVMKAAPKAPYDGLIVIADGVGWNPGSGVGYYGYYKGNWRYLEDSNVVLVAPSGLTATFTQ